VGKELLGKPVRELIRSKIRERIEKGQKIRGYILVNPNSFEAESYAKLVASLLRTFGQEVFLKEVRNLSEGEKVLKEAKQDALSSVFLARPLLFKEESLLTEEIPPEKDADMLTGTNFGKLAKGDLRYLSGTSRAVKELLDFYQIDVGSKKALVVGRSVSVGLPIALLLLKKNAYVTTVHSKTDIRDIREEAKRSDVIVLASGKRGLIRKEDLSPSSLLIDCGYQEDGGGDLGFVPEENVYTPVPGGVGPVTVSALIENAFFLKYGD